MGLIIGHIEIPAGAVIYKHPKTGVTYLHMDIEEGEELRITMNLESLKEDDNTEDATTVPLFSLNETHAGEEKKYQP